MGCGYRALINQSCREGAHCLPEGRFGGYRMPITMTKGWLPERKWGAVSIGIFLKRRKKKKENICRDSHHALQLQWRWELRKLKGGTLVTPCCTISLLQPRGLLLPASSSSFTRSLVCFSSCITISAAHEFPQVLTLWSLLSKHTVYFSKFPKTVIITSTLQKLQFVWTKFQSQRARKWKEAGVKP